MTGLFTFLAGGCGLSWVLARAGSGDEGRPGLSPCPLALAFIGPVSGDGLIEDRAARLAVQDYNAVHDRCVSLLEYDVDPRFASSSAAARARAIAGDPRVLGVVGPIWASEANEALPALDAAGVPVISPSAGAADLSGKWRVFHRTVPTETDQVEAAVRYLHNVLHSKSTFVVEDDSSFGAAAGPEMDKRLGGTRADRATVTTTDTDFQRIVQQVIHSGADSVYFAGLGTGAGNLVKQLRDAGSRIPVVGGEQLMTTPFYDAAGQLAVGPVVATCGCVPIPPAADAFRARYEANFGVQVGFYALETYDAATVLLSGLDTGHATRDSLLAWVDRYDGDGLARHIRFDARGDLAVSKLNVWAYAFSDGRFTADRVLL